MFRQWKLSGGRHDLADIKSGDVVTVNLEGDDCGTGQLAMTNVTAPFGQKFSLRSFTGKLAIGDRLYTILGTFNVRTQDWHGHTATDSS